MIHDRSVATDSNYIENICATKETSTNSAGRDILVRCGNSQSKGVWFY